MNANSARLNELGNVFCRGISNGESGGSHDDEGGGVFGGEIKISELS